MAQSEGVTQLDGLPAEWRSIFDFVVDPDKLVMWDVFRVHVSTCPRVHVSPESIASGEFVAVEPPGHVAFTRGWKNNAVALPSGEEG